jgi:hypothetical protein
MASHVYAGTAGATPRRMSAHESTQIIVVLQPQGESETSELLARLKTIVNLEPSVANGEISDLLSDDRLKRVLWATCEVEDLSSPNSAYGVLANTLEKMFALRPITGGRLKAIVMIDDPLPGEEPLVDDDEDAEVEDEAPAMHSDSHPLN